MASIFEYTDYRKYLADWFSEKKKSQKAFSYGSFALKAGFKDKGFFHNVIHGKRDLTKESQIKVSQGIGHSNAEAEYFENLVFFNKATTLKDRNYFYEKMNHVKSTEKAAVKALQTRKDQYEFYSQWYYSAIRSFIDMHKFRDNYILLAKNMYPRIKPREAKKAVLMLEKTGLLKKNTNGFFEISDKTITAGKEIVQLGLLNFHLQTAELAKKALQELPKEKRNVSGLTLGISADTYDIMCKEIELFQEKLLAMAENDARADRVFQLNFHFFPMSNAKGN
jgi:uncharacterized protein (TIGR02147 family)